MTQLVNENIELHKNVKVKLFSANVLHHKDELEEKLERCHSVLSGVLSGLSEKEVHDALTQIVCKSMKEHEEVSFGLLYTILTEPSLAQKVYRDLSFVSRDGLAIIVSKLHQILMEKFQRLLDVPKGQLLWLIGEMMKSSVGSLEGIVHTLLRQIAGGDTSNINLWFAENVLKLMKANKAWLVKNTGSMQLFVYTYIRVIEDHEGARFKSLRQMEVEFIVSLMREHFNEMIPIGRDLVRVLQNVFRIPEFTKLWKDILHRPQTLTPQFTGLPHLLSTRTSRKFLASRMTPDMENKLAFLTLKVKWGQQRRYQEWFFRQYLSAPESQTLLPDIVRFICGVIHPPNEILGSEVIPRWAILGWLYTICQNPVSQTNMKLALFFDWLFYQGDKDNIMNIEPAILLMHNSVRAHSNITMSLLDFICRMSTNYCPQFVNITKQGLYNSFKDILDKRVVSSLSPILKGIRIDKELKQLVSETLAPFCGPSERLASGISEESSNKQTDSPPSSPSDNNSFSLVIAPPASGNSSSNEHQTPSTGSGDGHDESSTDEAVFSDEEEENNKTALPPPPPPPLPNEKKESKKTPPPPSAILNTFIPINNKTTTEDFDANKVDEGFAGDDITELDEFQNLDSNLLKDNVIKLKNEKDESSRVEAMESIITSIESLGDFDDEQATPLCVCLANCLTADLCLPVIPDQLNEKSIESTLERPHYTLFRSLCALSRDDLSRENLYILLSSLHEQEPKIGYHFLFFLKASYKDEEKFSVYEDYISFFKTRTLKTVLIQDMKLCYEYDPALFMYLLVPVCKKFKTLTVGNKEMIKMLVSTVHPDEMSEILSELVMGTLTIVGENQVGALLETSLTWSSFEQSCLWQLINAEDTPIEMLVNVLPALQTNKHAETMNRLLIAMRAHSPDQEILRPVLCMNMEGIGKHFSLCLFRSWCAEEARELAHVMATLLSKPVSGRRKGNAGRHNPTLDQMVLHLNQYYKHCLESDEKSDKSLFKFENMRYALIQAKKNIVDPDIKTKCKGLFSEFSDLPARSTRKRKNQRVTRSGRGGGRRKDESSDESESDEDEQESDGEQSEDEEDEEDQEEDEEEEEEIKKPRPPNKKRRKSSKNVSSDED